MTQILTTSSPAMASVDSATHVIAAGAQAYSPDTGETKFGDGVSTFDQLASVTFGDVPEPDEDPDFWDEFDEDDDDGIDEESGFDDDGTFDVTADEDDTFEPPQGEAFEVQEVQEVDDEEVDPAEYKYGY